MTTGQPAGCGNPSVSHPGGDESNVTPVVMGWRFWSSSVMAGVPCRAQVVSETFVSVTPPSREPAAPCIDPTARSWADVHEGTAEVEEAAGDAADVALVVGGVALPVLLQAAAPSTSRDATVRILRFTSPPRPQGEPTWVHETTEGRCGADTESPSAQRPRNNSVRVHDWGTHTQSCPSFPIWTFAALLIDCEEDRIILRAVLVGMLREGGLGSWTHRDPHSEPAPHENPQAHLCGRDPAAQN